MAELRERVAAELENIDRVIAQLPDVHSLASLSDLELAGMAALLHSFYNGVENILKQMVMDRNGSIPDGASWHRELLNIAVSNATVSSSTAEQLRPYLAFRHFFSHAYCFDLDRRPPHPACCQRPSDGSSLQGRCRKGARKQLSPEKRSFLTLGTAAFHFSAFVGT
jgi:hypothetical protein